MKEKLVKSILVIFSIMALIGPNIIMAANEVVEEMTNKPKAEAILEMEIMKYHNFNRKETKGVLLQWEVKTETQWEEGREQENIKKTTILMGIPKIKEQLAERVEVISNSPQEISHYSYDKERGILEVETSSVFDVIAIYPETCYTEEKEEIKIQNKAIVQQELESEEVISKEIDFEQIVTENVGDIVSAEIETQDIYNGYMKANKANGTAYETRYQETMKVGISDKEIGENLVVEQENSHDIFYKTITMNQENMKTILGEEGSLKIIKEDGEVLQEIKQENFEEENLEITLEEGVKHLKIETSKPEKEGFLFIQMTKVIPSTIIDLANNKITTRQVITSGDIKFSETEKQIEIKDAQTEVEMQISEKELTNGNNNPLVLTATLRNDQNSYNLFNNPEIKITMPEEVEKVILGDVAILYGENLVITDTKVENNVITIALEGKQMNYPEGGMSKGTDIVIPMNVILKQELTTTQTLIKTSYSNQIITEDGYKKEEKEGEAIPISMLNMLQEEIKQEENILVANTEQVMKSQAPMARTIHENDIELQAYAQIGDKKIQNGDAIHDTEIIKYVVSVKNTTSEVIDHLDIVCQVPENTVYATIDRGSYLNENYEYKEQPEQKECSFSIDQLEPGQTQTGFYEVVVKDLETDVQEKQISNKIVVKSGENEVKEVTLENKIITSDLKVFLKSYIDREEENYFGYFLTIENTSGHKLENVIVESSEFQKEMRILQCIYYDDGIDGIPAFGSFSNGKITGVIPSLAASESRTIYFQAEAYNFDDKVNEVPLKVTAKAYVDKNDSYYSNENIRNAYPRYATVKMTSEQEGKEVKKGEEIAYQLEVKNEAKIRANIHVYDYLPEELQGIGISYEAYHIANSDRGTHYDLEEEANIEYTTEKIEKDIAVKREGNPDIDEYLEIPAGKSVVITIKAKVYGQVQTTEVSNYAVAERMEEKENNGIKTVSSNIVKFKIVESYSQDKEDDNKEDDNPVVEPNSISGVVWLDENQDGKRDNTETFMRNIGVSLYEVKTQKLVKQTTTDKQGAYSFTKVENGDYWIIFEYDSNNYTVTTYQKNGILPSLNSDVIMKDITIDGEQKRVAMTDHLTVMDKGLSNIDMGLVSNRTFNLKLEKYISEVKVDSNKGSKHYQYDNSKFSKVEIKAKEIQNSVITITYKIVISNEGDTEGFASKIVDQIPAGYTFDKSRNSGWIEEKNGKIVNTSLSEEVIPAGEKKEITIVLTKILTGDSTGTVTNNAYLEETKSINNLKDNYPQDNSDKAELLISIETGILTYTALTMVGIAVLVVIVIIIQRKTKLFSNKNFKNTLKMFVMMGIVGIVLVVETSVDAFSIRWIAGGVYGGAYNCGNVGWHLCAVNDHYYDENRYEKREIESGSDPTETLKETRVDKLANPECYPYDSNYNLVGPYNIRAYADATIMGRWITYTENGQVKQSTSSSMMVDRNGNAISPHLRTNTNYAFYLKVGVDVEIINEVKLKVTFENAFRRRSWTKAKLYYPCQSIGDGEHQNSSGNAVNTSAAKTQGMITMNKIETDSSYTYQNASTTVAFQAKHIKSSIVISKRDKQNQLDQRMPNVEFTLQMKSGKYAGQYVTPSSIGSAIYHGGKTTFKTDRNGDVLIRLLEPGTYELTEVSIPYYGYEETPKVITSSIIRANGNTKLYYEVVNRRKYVKLSGRVWEDRPWNDGKHTNENNYLWNTSEEAGDINDKLLAHVTVRLKDKNGNTVPFKASANGRELQEIETDENGYYVMWDVLIDKLNEYYIEFYYNGMKYESVPASIDKARVGNKAIEGQNRMDYNNNYTTIEPNKSLDQNGKSKYGLKYNVSEYTSNIRYGDNLKYGYSGQQYPINGTYDNFIIASNTKNAYNGYLSRIKTPEEIRAGGITEIENINLGVKERRQPDLSLIKDINKVKVTINNAAHIYNYGDRFNKNLWQENPLDMSPRVRYASKYGSMSYTRALYPSDVYYKDPEKKEDADGVRENELRVKITYQIGIKNTSSIRTIINKIDDYYDEKFFDNKTKVKVGKQIDEKGDIIETSQLEYDLIKNSGYNDYYKIQIKNMNMNLEENKENSIYIQLEVAQDRIKEIVEKNQNSSADVKLDNMAEIVSYSAKDTNGRAYAGIDQDSAPGNVNLKNEKTYEDDTDKAPGIKLVLQQQRQSNGKVFIDNALGTNGFNSNIVNTGKERQGSGIYENGEKGIKGVTVELFNVRTGQVADIYDSARKVWKKARTQTDENGEFYFEGFVPDDYKIIYTWGGQDDPTKVGVDKAYIRVQDYKATIFKDKTGGLEWYKQLTPRYSDATDDYNTRLAIDNQAKLITNANKEVIYNYSGQIELENGTKQELMKTMASSTPNFKVNLEYGTEPTRGEDKHEVHIKNIDFGIIERAKQALELTKRVKRVKVVLANGTVLIDADIKEDGTIDEKVKHTTYIPKSGVNNGQVKMEVDNEILQSAKLEVEYLLKVENKSEKEYLTKEYYTYGIGYGNSRDKLVALNPSTVIDYMDNKLAKDVEKIDGWNIYTEQEKKDLIETKGLLITKLKETLTQTNKVLHTQNLSKQLQPEGLTKTETTLSVYRMLPATIEDEDSEMGNDAEIIKIIKTGGSTLTTTPGNYVPSEGPKEVDEAKSEEVTIVPPTGLTVNYIAYTLLAISSLGILVSGIILIKKFVLK